MSQINNCPKCAANIAPHDFVCDYCGHVLFDRVKNTDSLKSNLESFDEGMGIIKENLNALYDIPKPSSAATIRASIRFLLALFTFGFILIFSHRPKKRFVKENFDKLKSIIMRNISFLKISSAGSNDLMSRIKVLEEELLNIDKSVKKGIIAKTSTYIIITALYVLWFIHVASLEPQKHSVYKVSSYDTVVQGNLINSIKIGKDTVKIVHTATGSYEEWEIMVKLNTVGLKDSNINKMSLNNSLVLVDAYGMEVKGFQHGQMDKLSEQKLVTSLTTQKLKSDYYKFLIKNDLNYPLYRDTIPNNISNYIIQIDSIFPQK